MDPARIPPLVIALGAVGLIALAVIHVDLRTEVAELRGRVHALERLAPSAAPPPPPPHTAAAPPTAAPPTAAPPTAAPPTAAPPTARRPVATPPPIAGDPPAPAPPAADRSNRETWRCAGRLPDEAVQRVVGTKGPPLYECWSRFAAGAPPVSARVLIRIDAQGSATDVHVIGLQSVPVAERCIGQEALTWNFPTPTGDGCAVVDLPFRFGG